MRRRSQLYALGLALLAWCTILGAAPPAHARGIGDARSAAEQAVPGAQHGVSEARIVSFGLFGPESVFESEARKAAQILSAWFGATVEPIVRFNGKRSGSVNARSIAADIRAAGASMDPDKDSLVVVLTSHGSPDGLAIVAGRREDTLTPRALRRMLDASGAKYRVVIISACYSGVFVPALADARTLVITAAAADRPSFGCEDGATWTYFGDAFFNRALRAAPDLPAAFKKARALVTAREKREGYEPSNPQMAGGSEVLALLARRQPE
jgi:Peptidase C13 family